MKKIILAIIILNITAAVYAKTTIKIPVDFISEITKTKEFKSSFNIAERILVKQIINNSKINGIKLKKYNIDTLMEAFNKDNMLQKYGTNKLVEPMTGITFEFNSDGKCKKEACTIVVDLNPNDNQGIQNEINEEDKNTETNNDSKMIFTLKRNSKNELEVVFPEGEE